MASALALVVVYSLTLLDQVIPPWGIPIAVLGIWLFLKKENQPLAVVGVVRPQYSWRTTVLMGVGCALLIILLGIFVYPPVLEMLGLPEQDLSSYEGVVGNNALLAMFLTVSWTTAGFGEELIFRGFLMAGLARCLGNSKVAWVVAVVVANSLFGLIHIGKGPGAVLTTGLNGAVLAGLYLLSRRSIWSAYIAHGLANTIGFLVIYTGAYESLG